MTRPGPQIRRVAVDDEADLHAWWTSGHEAGTDRPYDGWPPWAISRRALPQRREDHRTVLIAALLDEAEAGAALVVLPAIDNTHTAFLGVWVRPGVRRRGVGTALLAAAEQVAAEQGRRVLEAEAFAPAVGESAGSAFAAHHGYGIAEENGAKLLDLDAAPAGWAALDDEVERRRGGYRVAVSTDRVPDEHVAGLCALLSVFDSMLPASERDHEDAVWDAARLRAGEARNAANDRRQVLAVAVASDGAVVGFSDLRVDAPTATLAGVGGTLVLPEHRGRRLGLALKLATHRRLLELREQGRVVCTHAETQNATDNAAINRVNDRLGYRFVERALDLQKRTDGATFARPTLAAPLVAHTAALVGGPGERRVWRCCPCSAWDGSGSRRRAGPGPVRV